MPVGSAAVKAYRHFEHGGKKHSFMGCVIVGISKNVARNYKFYCIAASDILSEEAVWIIIYFSIIGAKFMVSGTSQMVQRPDESRAQG